MCQHFLSRNAIIHWYLYLISTRLKNAPLFVCFPSDGASIQAWAVISEQLFVSTDCCLLSLGMELSLSSQQVLLLSRSLLASFISLLTLWYFLSPYLVASNAQFATDLWADISVWQEFSFSSAEIKWLQNHPRPTRTRIFWKIGRSGGYFYLWDPPTQWRCIQTLGSLWQTW